MRCLPVVLLLLLSACHLRKAEDRRHITEFIAYIKTHNIDTTGNTRADTILFSQVFFSDEMRKKSKRYGLILWGTSYWKHYIMHSDSIAIEDEDLSKHIASGAEGDNAYKVIFIKGGVRTDSGYMLVDKKGVKSYMEMRKGERIVTWW